MSVFLVFACQLLFGRLPTVPVGLRLAFPQELGSFDCLSGYFFSYATLKPPKVNLKCANLVSKPFAKTGFRILGFRALSPRPLNGLGSRSPPVLFGFWAVNLPAE